MSSLDSFFAFFNGLVSGKFYLIQVVLKSLSCNHSKSLKSDFKHNQIPIKFIMVLLTALVKLSKIKAFLPYIKVRSSYMLEKMS